MGEGWNNRRAEVDALRTGIELGLTLIDTAEMYASGVAEEVVAEAIAGQRDRVVIVSKVLPQNASAKGVVAACERSLKRLGTDHLDLYLLHWRGPHPLAETVAGFEALKAAGKIAGWGVSNFDVADMAELASVRGGSACAANQVLYHVGERGIEWQLLPDARRAGIAIMAYCPLGQGELLDEPVIVRLAARHGVDPAAICLAYLLAKPGVIAIPKSARADRVRGFAAALQVKLAAEDLQSLDRAFPPPRRKAPLAMT
jgi:diketogulonate reductase-like aldo/keto reductase